MSDFEPLAPVGVVPPPDPYDFTSDPPLPPGNLSTWAESPTPYDPEPHREVLRGWLAGGLLALVAVCVFGALVLIGMGKVPATALVEGIFPSLVTLAGTALGFYFGGQQQRRKDE